MLTLMTYDPWFESNSFNFISMPKVPLQVLFIFNGFCIEPGLSCALKDKQHLNNYIMFITLHYASYSQSWMIEVLLQIPQANLSDTRLNLQTPGRTEPVAPPPAPPAHVPHAPQAPHAPHAVLPPELEPPRARPGSGRRSSKNLLAELLGWSGEWMGLFQRREMLGEFVWSMCFIECLY